MTTGLIVVDVQPAYDRFCGPIAQGVAKRINNTRLATSIFWVGENFTHDTESDVRHYLKEAGARPGKLARCDFIEKDYGFFRGWMDCGVADDIIVTVGYEMLRTRTASSAALDLPEVLSELLGDDEIESTLPRWNHLRLPTFHDARLRCFDEFDTCGGGNKECLAEIELYLQMMGRPYERLENLVY